MAKRRKESLIFLASSLFVVVAGLVFYINTSPVLRATPSGGCIVCHLDADVMESLYDVPEASGGGG